MVRIMTDLRSKFWIAVEEVKDLYGRTHGCHAQSRAAQHDKTHPQNTIALIAKLQEASNPRDLKVDPDENANFVLSECYHSRWVSMRDHT
jgi:hypothetical protein